MELATSDIVMAESTWSSVSVIQDALGGGIEIVGAVWVFLVGIGDPLRRSRSRAVRSGHRNRRHRMDPSPA